MTVEIVPATFDDVYFILRNQREKDRRQSAVGDWYGGDYEKARELMRFSFLWCFLLDKKPTVFIGGFPVTPTTWRMLLCGTDDTPRVKLSLLRWMKNTMIPVLAKQGATRLEAIAQVEYIESVRLWEAVGGVKEGTLRRYGANGEDFVMYARYL